MNNSKYRLITAGLLLITLSLTSCNIFNIEDRSDPNNSELNGVINNPTPADIRTLVTGTESSMRTDLGLYYIDIGMVGREMYRFLASEPRNTQDLLGKGNSVLDAGAYYTTRPWASFYTTIRNANILIQSVNTISSDAVSESEKKGVKGFANTIKAYQYLQALNLMNENGIREQDPKNPNKVGDLLSKSEALSKIGNLLDDAATSLGNAGSDFAFTLSGGFAGFNKPSTFLEFNRALRARVAIYTGDYTGALSYLSNSFIDASGDLKNGVNYVFSNQPNDGTNPFYSNPQSGSGDSYVVHPSFVADAESGDNRVVGDKAIKRMKDGSVNTASLDGLSSDYGLYVYKSPTDPAPIIRNAELLLIRAEANINKDSPDFSAAESDLNVIRNNAGLPDYSGSLNKADLNDEMLKQRRYELFYEGHRWVDMRRFGRLGQLPTSRSGDNVWESFPIPESENVGS